MRNKCRKKENKERKTYNKMNKMFFLNGNAGFSSLISRKICLLTQLILYQTQKSQENNLIFQLRAQVCCIDNTSRVMPSFHYGWMLLCLDAWVGSVCGRFPTRQVLRPPAETLNLIYDSLHFRSLNLLARCNLSNVLSLRGCCVGDAVTSHRVWNENVAVQAVTCNGGGGKAWCEDNQPLLIGQS